MFLTVLPVADTNYLKNVCMPPSNNTTPLVIAQRVAKLLSGMGLAINGKHVYCGDYIYSGHTMTLLMGYLVIKQCKSNQ
jgi:shingomyelin synthase